MIFMVHDAVGLPTLDGSHGAFRRGNQNEDTVDGLQSIRRPFASPYTELSKTNPK